MRFLHDGSGAPERAPKENQRMLRGLFWLSLRSPVTSPLESVKGVIRPPRLRRRRHAPCFLRHEYQRNWDKAVRLRGLKATAVRKEDEQNDGERNCPVWPSQGPVGSLAPLSGGCYPLSAPAVGASLSFPLWFQGAAPTDIAVTETTSPPLGHRGRPGTC